jgi:UDP-N-acetylmuramoyl-L-alanyl-D-glutamate--2,6-diaminopimelate ligase
VTRVVHDTRDVAAGALFCCVRGSRVDGHDLADAAVAAGASALVVDHPVELAEGDDRIPQVVVPDVRAAMGPLAAASWGHPSAALTMVGVTGTAGKTTVTHLVHSILEASGRPSGLIGTLSGAHTTPDATELQARLAAERDTGREAVVMEVSSHGIELHRVDGTHFAVAVFTNLSRDHLDFHTTMDDYFAAKARLFTRDFTDRAVVCVDDPWGRRLAADIERRNSEAARTAEPVAGEAGNMAEPTAGAGEAGNMAEPTAGAGEAGNMAEPTAGAGEAGIALTTYSLDTDVTDLEVRADGCRFTWCGTSIAVGLPGRFNAANALGAATTARVLGIDPATIAAGLRAAIPPAGRFEPVVAGQPFTVLVDYAHKPDALEQALVTSRELAGSGRVTVVFGCGGDRDATKRPIMGAVAARMADRVVVTSDNPRSEDPLAIIDEILAGVPDDVAAGAVVVVPDRRAAIADAVGAAEPGDLVLVAGKGHETTQTTGDVAVPFDDRVEARRALADLGFPGPAPSGEGAL